MVDPSEESVPQWVDPQKKPHVVGETQQCRSPTSIISAAVSKVLDDDDLLIEILLRVGFPTTLVRAAAVCRRWLHHASDHAFLRRFRKLNPPRLLGFYVNSWTPWTTPLFVPMLPQPAELAAVIRRASSSFDNYQSNSSSTHIFDCRNGNVFIRHCERWKGSTHGVHNLLSSGRDMVVVPRFPGPERQYDNFDNFEDEILSEEEGDVMSYLFVLILLATEGKDKVQVYRLQDGVWCMHHNLSIEKLPTPLLEPKFVLADIKIYMLAAQSDIIVLDLMASSFSTIQLPQGLEHGDRNTTLSRADDTTSVYLIHVNQLLLRIWLHNRGDWLLVDTICVREMCASLGILNSNASLQIYQVGDNAEFVFLRMGQLALYLDIKCRTLRKVYEIPSGLQWHGLLNIHPFMMIWPPTFPLLNDCPARNAI